MEEDPSKEILEIIEEGKVESQEKEEISIEEKEKDDLNLEQEDSKVIKSEKKSVVVEEEDHWLIKFFAKIFFKIPEFEVVKKDAIFQGRLEKEGEFIKSWRSREFLLLSDVIYYYDPVSKKAKGRILFDKTSKITKVEHNSHKFLFKISHATLRTFFLKASDENEMNRWIRKIKIRVKALSSSK